MNEDNIKKIEKISLEIFKEHGSELNNQNIFFKLYIENQYNNADKRYFDSLTAVQISNFKYWGIITLRVSLK